MATIHLSNKTRKQINNNRTRYNNFSKMINNKYKMKYQILINTLRIYKFMKEIYLILNMIASFLLFLKI